jgi:mono/diheme cytochrome c family protein
MSHSGRTRLGRGLAWGLILGLLTAEPVRADKVPSVEELRRGLIATYRDAGKPPTTAVRLEPTVALALKAVESPDPRLRPSGTAVWRGYLNILRADVYRFSARLRGQLRVRVGGKEVLAATVKETSALKEGPEVKLEAGVQPFEAEFTRLSGGARVELLWQAPFFRREPLPYRVLGHLPGKAPASLKDEQQIETGRLLVEEAGCAHCHKPDEKDALGKGLVERHGPDLSQVGAQVQPGWLIRWLEAPRKLRPGTLMPELFSADEAGRVERYAVARYLASLGGPVEPDRPDRRARAAAVRGERLFTSLGCSACHGPVGSAGTTPTGKRSRAREDEEARTPVLYRPARLYPLPGLGSKTTVRRLAEYLLDPLKVGPHGRMPNMLLQRQEADALAHFLCRSGVAGLSPDLPAAPREGLLAAFKRVEPRPEEQANFARLAPARQWLDLGQRLVIDRGCNNCHTVAPGGKPFASVVADAALDDLKKPGKQDAGCLATDPKKRGKAPCFGFDAPQTAAIRAFLTKGLRGAGAPAPGYAARLDLQRFNCLACHNRDGEGGLSVALTEELRRDEKAENAEAVVPPTLTGVAHKLRTPWLRDVLLHAGRARPWMGLRMPQFGAANVGRLPEALCAAEGTEPDDTVHKTRLSAATIRAGRLLVGKGGFGCISCHDIAGIPNTGTRGPDLAGMNRRVRHDWYLRWLEQPQRLAPGTRMPSVFNEGKSLLDTVLGGSAAAQADALWGYLSLGDRLPLPEGLEKPKGMIVSVGERPVLLRTFLPEVGTRAIAVGFPGGVSLAFDAGACRLAYAWSGPFLDAAPVWGGRGGNPARVLGPRFWKAPAGCPVGIGAEPPDFAARAKDPAYGGPVPEGSLYTGPLRLRFAGYTLDRGGVPSFRYRLQEVAVSERLEGLRGAVAAGVARRFRLQVPAGQTLWLLAGATERPPRLQDGKGEAVSLDLKSGKAEADFAGRFLLLPQEGDRVVVLAPAVAPAGTRWHLQRTGGTWQALLRVPAGKTARTVAVELKVWAPYRDEPALLKELLSAK